jgi:hypothetical protein
MRKLFLLTALIISFLIGIAQDKTVKEIQATSEKGIADDTAHKSGWKFGGVFSVNIGQGGSRNWAAGAEKFSFSTAAYLSVFANKKEGRFNWRNTLDLGYAFVNTTSLGNRKTDDKIDFFSKAGYDLSKTVSVAGVVSFRSQFYDGFDYNYLGKGYRRKTSGFMAPAYLIVAPGIDWHPTSYFSVFISPVSGRWVFVTNEPKSYYFPGGVIPAADGGGFEAPLSTYYGVDPARKVRAELGGFASVLFGKELIKNVIYKSRLDLYSNYLKTDRFTPIGPDQLAVTEGKAKPQNVDVYWTNLIVMKVNKFLNVTYNFDLIYDDDVRQFGENKTSAATQLRSLLAVGFAVKF